MKKVTRNSSRQKMDEGEKLLLECLKILQQISRLHGFNLLEKKGTRS
jgi:hypothetical protein